MYRNSEANQVSTASNIRRFVKGVPYGQIFSTRECLHFGSRASVDQTFYRLVGDCKIVRLAYGLFVKLQPGMKMPSIEEIAIAKAKAFSKEIFVHGQDAAFEVGIADQPNKVPTYYVTGSACSSFRSLVHGRRVYLKSTAARKVYDKNTRVGKVLRGLWHIGEEALDLNVLQKATMNLNRDEIRQLRLAAYRVPYWLARFTNRSLTNFGQVLS